MMKKNKTNLEEMDSLMKKLFNDKEFEMLKLILKSNGHLEIEGVNE